MIRRSSFYVAALASWVMGADNFRASEIRFETIETLWIVTQNETLVRV